MQSFLTLFSTESANQRDELRQRILGVDADQFDPLALTVFRYQATRNPAYQAYLSALRVDPAHVQRLEEVPFMPIAFFKQHQIISASNVSKEAIDQAVCFASSGTTGANISRHYLFDASLYKAISQRIFEETYGPLTDFHILALLPSYLERNNSSLVYMVQEFVGQTESNGSGFYLYNTTALAQQIKHLLITSTRKILLIGVTFALLDWVETTPDLSFIGESGRVIVMETGGMKGRRREMIREEVHQILGEKLRIDTVHSEYGMTELLSQGYSKGHGLFYPGATMRIILRDINDPFTIFPTDYARTGSRLTGERRTGERRTGERRTGGINVIDLANLDSCSFIETSDLGQYGSVPGSFKVMGRFDNSDVRGCNLMVI